MGSNVAFLRECPEGPLTLNRKQDDMNDQIRKQQEQPQQTEQPKQAELEIGVVRYASLSVARPVHLQLATEGTSTTWVEPEEILIADPRG